MTSRIALKGGDLFLNGKYRLKEKLGEGGMSQVWAATELHSNNIVAIKVLHEQTRNFALRFKQECRVYAKLRHPNIVAMYASGSDDDGVLYIVMDLLEAKTLRRILQVSRRLDFLQAAHVGVQLADACAYMHAEGIWHRDLKPENLMVGTKKSKKGHLWVVDFGIAKLARPEDMGLDTSELPDVGTLRYMAPEQCEGTRRREVDGRADIYAFGAIMYEMLTGSHIFIREGEPMGAAQMLLGHMRATVRPVRALAPACPEDVAVLIERCVAKHPDDRPRTFDEIGDTLAAAVQRSVLAPDLAVARRLEERRREAARAEVFADLRQTRQGLPPVPEEPADNATTNPLPLAPRAPPAPQAVSPPRVSQVSAPPPGWAPGSRAAGLGGTTPMPNAAALLAAGVPVDPSILVNPTYAARLRELTGSQSPPPKQGLRGTTAMPSAATLLAQGYNPAAVTDPTYAGSVRTLVAATERLSIASAAPSEPTARLPLPTAQAPARAPIGPRDPLALSSAAVAAPPPLARAVLKGAVIAFVLAALLVVARHTLQAIHPEAPALPSAGTPASTGEPR